MLRVRYIGGDKQVHKTDDFIKRTVFSGWDVFRSQFPLQTIINPEVVNDMICSFISLAEENGTKYYDRWEFLNAYSGCMVGNPAISVIADAYRKGIRNYDVKKAYAYAVNTAEKMGNDKKLGYVREGFPKHWNMLIPIGVSLYWRRIWAVKKLLPNILNVPVLILKFSMKNKGGSDLVMQMVHGKSGLKKGG